jgi:hypothetical protein
MAKILEFVTKAEFAQRKAEKPNEPAVVSEPHSLQDSERAAVELLTKTATNTLQGWFHELKLPDTDSVKRDLAGLTALIAAAYYRAKHLPTPYDQTFINVQSILTAKTDPQS